MLLILIAIAWLAAATLLAAVCRTAADADAAPAIIVDTPQSPFGEGLRVWELRTTRTAGARRNRRGEPALQPSRLSALQRRQFAGHAAGPVTR